MGHKKILLEDLVDYVNQQLANKDTTKDQRFELIVLIEKFLHDAGSYNGYRYLSKYDLDEGVIPGVHISDDGHILPVGERFVNTDAFRRMYF